MSNITKVCGWCGQLLNHWGAPPQHAETCEQVYGKKCSAELDHQSQLDYEHDMYLQEQEEDCNE